MRFSKTKYFILAILMLGLFSCIKDDLSHCPPKSNVDLNFIYTGDTKDPSMFAKMIETVNLYVYDNAGNLLEDKTQIINKAALDARQGSSLLLPEGKYKIVCWANLTSLTQLTDISKYKKGRIHNPNFPLSENMPSNDHLYFGDYDVVVPEEGVVTEDIVFKGSHINMEVYVSNFTASNSKKIDPIIAMHNLMPQYTMQAENAVPSHTTYYPTTEYNGAKKRFDAIFQVLSFEDKVSIDIIDPLNKDIIWSVDVNKFITDNSIDITKNEVTIAILVEFTDLGVKVTVPNWIINPISPGGF